MRQIAAWLHDAFGLALLLSLSTLSPAQTTYTLTELPTLGGTVGAADSIDDNGRIAGYSNLAGDRTEHAVLWINDTVTDLGTLDGPNSSVGFPTKNSQGMLVGFSQTTGSDPLRKGWNYFCGPSGAKPLCQGKNLITRGFIWQNGEVTPLPTLGGNISEAFGINNSGQVVGVAETGNTDSTCLRPQVLDYFGVIWNPDGTLQALLPYPGDRISAAVGINNNGQWWADQDRAPLCLPRLELMPSYGKAAQQPRPTSATSEAARTMSPSESTDRARLSAFLPCPAMPLFTRFFGTEGLCRTSAPCPEMF